MLETIKKEELIILLNRLANKIKTEVEESISAKSVEPEEETYMRYTVTEFNYSEKGVTKHSGSSQFITKKI